MDVLKAVAKAHAATPSQVALAWMLQFHGETVLAIPGASKVRHAEENVGAMGMTLSARELSDVDAAGRR